MVTDSPLPLSHSLPSWLQKARPVELIRWALWGRAEAGGPGDVLLPAPRRVTSVLGQIRIIPNHLPCCTPSISHFFFFFVLKGKKREIHDHTVGALWEKQRKQEGKLYDAWRESVSPLHIWGKNEAKTQPSPTRYISYSRKIQEWVSFPLSSVALELELMQTPTFLFCITANPNQKQNPCCSKSA